MNVFEGKAALISGGSSGIGLALAKALARKGASVAVTGTQEDKLAAAVASLEAAGAKAMSLRFDVTDEAAWRDAAQRVETDLGPIRFLGLNAGVGGGGGTIEAVQTGAWQANWSINVMGVVHGLQACLPGMIGGGQDGHVMFTSSIAGAIRAPMMGPYGVTKAAVIALAENLRTQLKTTPLGVSVIIPGPIRTDFPQNSRRHSGGASDPHMTAVMTEMLQKIGLDPDEFAAYVLDRIGKGAFYIFSHSGARAEIAERSAEFTEASDIGLAHMPSFTPPPAK